MEIGKILFVVFLDFIDCHVYFWKERKGHIISFRKTYKYMKEGALWTQII